MSQIKHEIEKLPERSREIIQCVYLQGLHYKETAHKLGISVATVNALLVNALKKIRQAYPQSPLCIRMDFINNVRINYILLCKCMKNHKNNNGMYEY